MFYNEKAVELSRQNALTRKGKHKHSCDPRSVEPTRPRLKKPCSIPNRVIRIKRSWQTGFKIGLYRLKKGIFRGFLELCRLIYHPGMFWQCCSLNLLHAERLYLLWCSLRSQISGSETDTIGICVLLQAYLQPLGTTRPQLGTTPLHCIKK